MRISHMVITLLLLLTPSATLAFTEQEASQCMGEVLKGYEKREAPLALMDIPKMASNILGVGIHNVSHSNRPTVNKTLKKIIRQAFAESMNRFEHIIKGRIKSDKKGFVVNVKADIWHANSQRWLRGSNIAVFVTGRNGCGIWKITIDGFFSSQADLRSRLLNHPDMSFISKTLR